MNNYCAFSKNHKCIHWSDYQLTQLELEEADELCHGNWIEIERLRKWTDALTRILDEHGLSYPSEWEFSNYSHDDDTED